MALSADRSTARKEIQLLGYPVATNTVIYKGSLVAINAGGYAVPAADTAGFLGVAGVAEEYVSNNPGANGAKKIRVRSGCAFDLAATSITQAMVGTPMVVVDDQTFDDPAGATNDIPAGKLVQFISTTRGMLFIPLGGTQPDLIV